MRHVTPISVRARIEELKRAEKNVSLSIREEFELACLTRLLAYMMGGAA